MSMIPMAGEALNGVGIWLTRRERIHNREDAAVESILTALNQTKHYLVQMSRGEAVNREAERELVGLWTTAAVRIRRTDSALADRLQTKAEYWTNPDNWTEEEVVAYGIKIDEVTESAKKLLNAV